MKKIRILALLLALLMIPFGLLFACEDDEEPGDDEEKEEEGDDNENEGGGGDETTTLVGNKTVDDGSKMGYLAFFSFDNADNGNLGVIAAPSSMDDPNYASYSELKPIEPYFTYFRGAIVSGGAYTVKTLTASDKYLSIQRTDKKVSAPKLDFNIGTALKQDLTATHIIEFDMDFSKGLFGSAVTFAGIKENAHQTLFTIEDDVMYDCNGNAIYGEKDTDKEGWISVAVVIDDTKRTYDIYIDTVKQTNGLEYSNESYKSWNMESLTGYRFSVAATTEYDVYLRIDDVAVRNGKEKDLGTLAGTDTVVKYYDNGKFKYSYLKPTKNGVAKFIASQAGINDLKSEMFGTGALASDRVTLSKINTVTGAITDVYHDYGALQGKYDEVLTLKSGNAEIKLTTYNGSITYDADTTDTTDAISGTYTYADGVLTFNWGANAAPQIEGADVVAGKYADAVLSVYSDAACTAKLADLELDDVAENNVLGENEIYAVKFTNIQKIHSNGATVFQFDNAWYNNNKANLSSLKFSFYATQDMVDRDVCFMFRFCMPYEADGSTMYDAAFTVKPGATSGKANGVITYTAGLNTYQFTVQEIEAVKSNDAFSFSKIDTILIGYNGGDANAYDENDYQIYITELGFEFSNVRVEVEGPDSDNIKCGHVDAFDEDAFKPVDEMVIGNCAYGSHYLLKCTECGATKIDTSRPTGYIDPHVYDGTVDTDYSTCFKDGRIYKTCIDCGHEETIEVLASEGHQSVIVSIVGKVATQVCKSCGLENTFIIRNEMMTFKEKIDELGLILYNRNNWNADHEVNEDDKINEVISRDDKDMWIWTAHHWNKNTIGATFDIAETDYGKMLLMQGGPVYGEVYIDYVPGGSLNSSYTIFKETNFVFEFDYMLGTPGDNGQYASMDVFLSWRNGPAAITSQRWGHLKLQPDGSVQLSGYNANGADDFTDNPKFALEKNVVYNIALHYNLNTNKVSLYVDGVFIDDCQLLASLADSSILGITQCRFWCMGLPNEAEMYFNNFLFYEAPSEPICVLTPGIVGGSDFEGEIPLEDNILNVMQPDFNVFADGRNVKVGIPAALYLKQYVFEFGINAETLEDGVLLTATKNGVGYDREIDLVTVNGGKIYVAGLLVSEKLNVKLSLAFDDNANSLIVYVDGQRIDGTIYFEGDFADAMASIRSFTFNTVDNYGVSGLKMYTGNEVK